MKAVVLCDQPSVFAESLAKHGGWPLSQIKMRTFSIDEVEVSLDSSSVGECAIVVCNMPAANLAIVYLQQLEFILRDICKKIVFVVPYMYYSRQNNGFAKHLLGNLTNHTVITLDAHQEIHGVVNINTIDFVLQNFKDFVVVAPDAGSSMRLQSNQPSVTMQKRRNEDGSISMFIEQVDKSTIYGKKCIIVDDIIDTGGTILQATKVLKELGASEVAVYATHNLLTYSGYIDKFLASNNAPDKLCTSNSMEHGFNEFGIDVSVLVANFIISTIATNTIY